MKRSVLLSVAAGFAILLSTLSAQSVQPNNGSSQELVFHIPTYSGPDSGLGRRMIGHVDITFCAPQKKQTSGSCKIANPSFIIQLPVSIKGSVQEAWYNVISSYNGIRGEIRADVESPRSIKMTYTSTLSDQEETFRIYFMLIQ
jgi:hypothetical protein